MFKDFRLEIKILLVVLLAFFAVSFGAFLFLRESDAPDAPPVQPMISEESDTSVTPRDQDELDSAGARPELVEGWQTYRNAEFGFEVKYPVNWSIIGVTSGQPAFSDGKAKISPVYM